MKKIYQPGQRLPARRSIFSKLLIAAVLLCTVTFSAYSQPKNINVDFNGRTLEQVIEALKQKTGYDFVYRKGLLSEEHRVSLTLQNASLEEILDKVLPGTLAFQITGKVVVINSAPTRVGIKDGFQIKGTVYESQKNGRKVPLQFAAVMMNDYLLHAMTDQNGQFTINKVPGGKTTLRVTMLGKVPVTMEVNVDKNANLDITMEDENFRLEEVVVTAKAGKTDEAPSTVISRTAIDHLQATSITDVLSLMPGNIVSAKNLNNNNKIVLRGLPSKSMRNESDAQLTGNAVDMTSLGVSIIMNGAPLSNNANMQSLSSTTAGTAGANPNSGFDARSIPTDNIESVEVIAGIPSVQYGDVSSGVIIINSKAGRSPLRVTAKVNPKTYMFSAGAGNGLGENGGFLNYNIDYLRNSSSLTQAYNFYDRATANFIYSRTFADDKLRTTTSLDVYYGRDLRKKNPDDLQSQIKSNGNEKGFRFNTRGNYNMNLGWWKDVQYVASVDYAAKDFQYESQRTALQVYTPAMKDGDVLSNLQGTPILDDQGNVIVPANSDYVRWFPSGYVGRFEIKGRELNLYGKVMTSFVKTGRVINNQMRIGADIRHIGNPGNGKTFSADNPPISGNSSTLMTGVRPRSYNNIKSYNSLGVYLEDVFQLTFAEDCRFKLLAGLRYDKVSVVGDLISPRLNATLDIIPRILSIKGGYGILGKMPTLMHIRPEELYVDYVNFNNLTSVSDAASQRMIVTTRVFETLGKDLEIAKNTKSEIGFNLRIREHTLSVTGFRERMKNGYSMDYGLDTYTHTTFNNYQYDRVANTFTATTPTNTLLWYQTTRNSLVINTDGVEFDLALKRFDAIRTSFALNGAWMRTETYYNDYTFYNGGSQNAMASMGIYEKGWLKEYMERFVTTLRTTHNIPRLGFVITLTTQATLWDKDWRRYGKDAPIQYISVADGQIYDFPYADRAETNSIGTSEFRSMLRAMDLKYTTKESLKPLFCFHINVTKEIGDWMRVSFYANNMLRSYQLVQSKRDASTWIKRNPAYSFGLELSLTIK